MAPFRSGRDLTSCGKALLRLIGYSILLLACSLSNSKSTSDSFFKAQSPTIPLYKDFYFFNLTNAEEFHNRHGGVKPNLTEIGPYSYREYRNKSFVEIQDPDLMGYTQQKQFFFSSSTSKPGLHETDTICTINIPLVAAITAAEGSIARRASLRAVINLTNTTLYICHSVRALAWNYTDALIKTLHLAKQYPIGYFSMQVNNSANDRKLSIVHTGSDDIKETGEYVQWDGQKKLQIWPYHTGANDINGTEGLAFRPNLKEGDGLTVFVDDIQRSVDLVYLDKVKPGGKTAFRYGIDNRTFKSAFKEPENARWESWCPDGMFYLGPTQPLEVPIYGSKPYFLDGDPILLDSVEGLDPPNRTLHDTMIDVEPISGTNLNFRRQLQINMQVNRTKSRKLTDFPMTELTGVKGYKSSGVLYFPVLYINEGVGPTAFTVSEQGPLDGAPNPSTINQAPEATCLPLKGELPTKVPLFFLKNPAQA